MQRLKKIFVFTGITLAILMMLLLVITWIFDDAIKRAVISTLNSKLTTEVKTSAVDFSLFRHFPNAAVVFTDVKVIEPRTFTTTGTVLTAHKVSLLFNILDVVSGNYRLRKVVINEGTLNLQLGEDGSANYEVWKKDASAAGPLQLELKQVEIAALKVVYYDAANQSDLECTIEHGTFSGNFTDEKYAVTANAKLLGAGYSSGGVRYVVNKDVEMVLSMDADRGKGTYSFHETRAKLTGLDLTINGTVKNADHGGNLDLIITSPGSDLRSVFAVLPGDYTKRIDEFEYNGAVDFNCTVKGTAEKPLLSVSFNATNAGLSPRGTPYKLSNMRFKGYFTNRKSAAKPVTWLKVEHLTGKLEGKPLTADLEVEDFRNPRVRLNATLDATLEVLSRFYTPDTLTDLTGRVLLNASFAGIPGQSSTYRSAGTLQMMGVGFRIKGRPIPFTGIHGTLRLEGGDVVAESITGRAGSSDLAIQGTATDLVGYLIRPGAPLQVRATLNSSSLDLDELLAKEQTLENTADTSFRLKIASFINFSLGVKIDSLRFRKFRATHIQGDIMLRDQVITTRQLEMETADGQVHLKGMIDGQKEGRLRIDYDAAITDLDITRLFYEMGNFGQEVIIDKNLKGRVTAEVVFKSEWNDRLIVDTDRISVTSTITIQNGELNNFEPMLALSKYLKGSDLRNIRFSTLTNTIEIKNRNIHIPQMEIKSSALDLTISGTHDFDNRVNYSLQLYLSQLLGRKVRKQNTEFGTIEEDGLGRSRIFLTMTGSASDPVITADRKGVEKKISAEIKNEVKSIKETIRQEFGKGLRDTVPASGEKKKQQELQIEFED